MDTANIRAKEKFISTIQGVNKEEVFSAIEKNTEGLDLYTYFVSYGAMNTGNVNLDEIKAYVHKLYADWYFLNRNDNDNINAYKLTHQTLYSPQNLSSDDAFELVECNKYSDVLPIRIQYLNKLEEKFFVAVDTDKLYARKSSCINNEARLYLNLPAGCILDFVKEFLDRAYLSEWSAIVKFLSNDSRCDTVIIYTDYSCIDKVVDEIEGIRADFIHKFRNVGKVNPLLGKVNEFIGFGEKPENGKTYFYSRCEALSNVNQTITGNLLKKYLIEEEKAVIFRNDERTYTPSEYLAYLIEKNARELIENKISKLERAKEPALEEIKKLKALRSNIEKEIGLNKQVEELKKSLTRNIKYTCKIDGVGEDEFDYVDKLYTLFKGEKSGDVEEKEKKRLVSAVIFKPTKEIFDMNTKAMLDEYFRLVLMDALEDLIKNKSDEYSNSSDNAVLSNLKSKKIEKLKVILKSIIDDNDDGKEYLDTCVYDYIRMLSVGAMENIEICVEDNILKLDNDINADILNSFPEIIEESANMSNNNKIIDNKLREYGINPDDVCVNSVTRFLSKERVSVEEELPRFYYDPTRAL